MLSAVSGDLDLDYDVDGRDFFAWQRGYGTVYTSSDLLDVQENYGMVATSITLQGTGATVSGSGATVSDSVIAITEGGFYTISGTLTDGQIIVATDDEADEVTLILNGVNITNNDGPAIYIASADETTIHLAEGS